MLTVQKSQQLSTTSAMPLGDYRTKNELWSELQSSKLAPAIPSVCDSLPDGPDHPEVAATLNDLGNAHGALGDPRTKKDFLERVLKIEERHFGADRPEVAATLNDIGNALGRLSHKERIMERSSKLAPAIPSVCDSLPDGPDHPEVAATLNDLGNAHGALGDPRTKKDFLERVLKIEERHFGADRPEVAATLNDIGNALGRLSHKERIMERASIFKARSSNSFCATLNDLGNAHGALGDPRTKKDFLERVLKIEERHFGADRPEVAATLNDIGNALGRLSHKERIMERASIFKARSSNSFCVR